MSNLDDIFYDEEISNYLYVFFGIICMLTNAIALWIHANSRELRETYVSSIFLSSAQLITGLSFIVLGTYRLMHSSADEVANEYHNEFVSYVIAFLLLLGAHLPAFIGISIAQEKIIAAKKPFWYYNNWCTRHGIMTSSMGVLLGLTSTCIGYFYLKSWYPPKQFLPGLLSIFYMFDWSYATYLYLISMVFYFSKFAIFFVVYMQHCTQFQAYRRNIEQTKVIFAAVSILLLCYYGLMNLTIWLPYFRAKTLMIGTGNCAYLMDCSLSLLLYTMTRDDFRKELGKSVFGKFLSVYKPIAGSNGTARNENTSAL